MRAVNSPAASVHVGRDQFHLAWDRSIEPIATIGSGEIVEFDALDASCGQITASSTLDDLAALDFSRVDQVNGPIAVEGAEPGDTLEIELLDFQPADWGWTASIPGFGLLAEDFPDPALRITPLGGGPAEFLPGVRIPLAPFCGELGVAPHTEGAHSTIPPDVFGGNMDTRHLTAGTKLFLPVFAPGGRFSLGDGHAAQAEIVAATPDGAVYAVSPSGRKLWRYDYARGAAKTFASEVVAADLNRDGRPELVFGVYGRRREAGGSSCCPRAASGCYDLRLSGQGEDGNGIGIPAAPSIADLDGDRRLEIVVSTFDHGLDVYRVPRSPPGRLLAAWPTGRGNLRSRSPPPTARRPRPRARSRPARRTPARPPPRAQTASSSSEMCVMTSRRAPALRPCSPASPGVRCPRVPSRSGRGSVASISSRSVSRANVHSSSDGRGVGAEGEAPAAVRAEVISTAWVVT